MFFRILHQFIVMLTFVFQQLFGALFAFVTFPFTGDGGFTFRMRILFDRKMTAANALDKAIELHGKDPILFPDVPLDYDRLAHSGIDANQIHDFVCRVGNVLKGECGLQRWDRVAVFKTDAPDYSLLGFAVIRAGGITVPINPGMKLRELAYYLEHTKSSLLITDAATLKAAGVEHPEQLPMVRHFIFPRAPEGFSARHTDLNEAMKLVPNTLEPVPMSSDADVMLVHTSGTTGFPKAVICTSSSIVHGVKAAIAGLPMTRRNRALTAAPNNHLIAHQTLLLVTLGGIQTICVSDRSGKNLLETIQKEKVTVFLGFPLTYLRMYLEGLDKYDLSSVGFWMNAADSAHEVHMRAFTAKGAILKIGNTRIVSSMFVDTFGSSEVGGAGLHRYVTAGTTHFKRCIGRPHPGGVSIKVTDEHGKWVGPNHIGRLLVYGGSIFKGYWNAHERLHGVMYDGWWWTGDVVYYDWLGRFYHLDRDTDTIHTPTGPVYTLMAEEVIMNHPDVGEVACIGLPGPGDVTLAAAVVYPRPGHHVDPVECKDWIDKNLLPPADLRTPVVISAVIAITEAEMPLGLTGKILKRRLRETYEDWFMQTGAEAKTEKLRAPLPRPAPQAPASR